jgi:SAM-dependent methyltransferase
VIGRERLARHLRGSGIEIGAGHQPFAVPPGVSVTYVDKWEADVVRALYPELPDELPFVEPQVLTDLDTDRLGAFGSRSQDFVIASHVLEHVADPLGLLDECRRVLRRRGVLILVLPDRHLTFDRRRTPTPLAHLRAEHRAGVTRVDDAHMHEFLSTAEDAAYLGVPDDPQERQVFFDWHRRRSSIHVHCWDEREFDEVLRAYRWKWRELDRVHSADNGLEFGYALARR